MWWEHWSLKVIRLILEARFEDKRKVVWKQNNKDNDKNNSNNTNNNYAQFFFY